MYEQFIEIKRCNDLLFNPFKAIDLFLHHLKKSKSLMFWYFQGI